MRSPNSAFYKKLKSLTDETKYMNILYRNLEECRQMIVDNAPMRTGEYAASIQVDIDKSKTGIVGEIYTPMKDLRNWLEHGTGIYRDDGSGRQTPWTYYDRITGQFYRTVGMTPRPHWTPALSITRQKLRQDFKEALRRK